MTRALAVGVLSAVVYAGGHQPGYLAGRWIAVSPASAAGYQLEISQDESVIRFVYERPHSPPDLDANRDTVFYLRETTTYRLDGSSTDNARITQAFRSDGKPLSTRTMTAELPVRSRVVREKDALVLIEVTSESGHLRFERKLTLDVAGRLVVERRRPVDAVDQDAAFHSARILEPRRVVYERR